jgi:hypothetical protein
MASGLSKPANALTTKMTNMQERDMKTSTFTAPDGVEIFYKDWGTGPVVTFFAWMAVERRCMGRTDVVPWEERLSRHRA